MADKSTMYIQAKYSSYERFKWPKNIDIKGEGITYFVKWGCLNIFKGDELIAKIETKHPASEHTDWECPDSTEDVESDDESEANE